MFLFVKVGFLFLKHRVYRSILLLERLGYSSPPNGDSTTPVNDDDIDHSGFDFFIAAEQRRSTALSDVGEEIQDRSKMRDNTALAALNTQFLFQIGILNAMPMVLGCILKLGFLKNQGMDIADRQLLDYISESSTMSKSLVEYGKKMSCAVTTARRLSDFPVEAMIKDKG